MRALPSFPQSRQARNGWFTALPESHPVQTPAPAYEKWPHEHCEHDDEPEPEDVPAGHVLQSWLPEWLHVPASHVTQLDAPSWLLLPAGQSAQALSSVEAVAPLDLPGLHRVHCLSPELLHVPEAQGLHSVWSAQSW